MSRERQYGDADLRDPFPMEPTLLDRSLVLPVASARWLFGAATVAVAVLIRLIGLDRWPLSAREADIAHAAHQIVRGDAGSEHFFGAPAAVVWTAIAFFAGWSADSVARVSMAIIGIAVVVAAMSLGRTIGRDVAFATGFVIALSPTMIAASRRIDAGILYIFLTLAVILSASAMRHRGGLVWAASAGVASALLVLSGPLGIPAVMLAWVGALLLVPETRTAPRDAWIALAAGTLATVVLVTTIFVTRPASFTASLVENAELLWNDHITGIGRQSWMPVFNLVINEPLIIALATVAIVASPQRMLVRWVGYWFLVAIVMMTLLGDVGVGGYALVTLPAALLAGIGGAHLVERVQTRTLRSGNAWMYVGSVLLMLAAAVSLMGLLTGGTSGNTLDWLFRFALVVVAGVLPLSLAISWIGQRVEGNRLVLILCAFLVLVSTVTIRSAVLAASERPGLPGEPLAVSALGADIPIIVGRIDRISRDLTMAQRSAIDPGGGHGLRIAIDARIAQPFAWYFRDYPNATLFDPDTTAVPVDAELVILDGSRNAQAVAPGFAGQPYLYRYETPRVFTSPDWVNIVTGIVRPNAWRDFVGFLINREPQQRSAQHQFQLLATGDIAERLFASTGPYGLSDRPGPGSAAGQLNRPRGIAVGPDGSIFVVDSRNARINVYGPDGTFLRSFGSEGSAPGQLGRLASAGAGGASGIAVDPEGNIYVADTWNHRIQVFAADGTFVRAWGQFFDASDDPVLAQTQPGSFYGPRGIVFHNDLIYVTDTGNERVQVFTPDGTFVRMFGRTGSGDGELLEPVGIAIVADNEVIVADSHNARISRFTLDGEWIGAWAVNAWQGLQFFEPYLAVGADGTIYATTSTSGIIATIQQDGTAGTPITSSDLRQPYGIAINEFVGDLMITDGGMNAVVRIIPAPQ